MIVAGGDQIEDAVEENVRRVAGRLRNTDDVPSERVEAGTVTVVGADHDLDDGSVDVFDKV